MDLPALFASAHLACTELKDGAASMAQRRHDDEPTEQRPPPATVQIPARAPYRRVDGRTRTT